MSDARPSLLVYLHGFNSSPLSQKAQIMVEYCQTYRSDIELLVPQLPCFPHDAAVKIETLLEPYSNSHNIGVIGSSLGGYFSVWVNSLFKCRAVVVNPAIKPYDLLLDFLGEQENPYTKEKYVLQSKHIGELKQLDIDVLNDPEQFWLLQQEGDEVLDYQQAVEKFRDSRSTIEPGGDHSFVGFERYAAEIIEFLRL
ncbi:esterase YqiA [Vibrio sp.]|uniref:Esterase YqiA n=1 Tax=Vibrio viridaestus TaxID=2487322 RepID=A0A3N9THN2_9VIBR|nr:esterase YqiA [Vibrio viridaestus]MDC0610671.1 esterase YqiA [Vibrio sp.]RQW63798.1 esterase YqiA [Vibrio viridaestus]